MFGAALTPGTVLYVYILHCVSYCCILSILWSPPDTSSTTAAFFSVLLALRFWMLKTPFACERPVHIYQLAFFQACFCLNILWLDTTNLSLHLSHQYWWIWWLLCWLSSTPGFHHLQKYEFTWYRLLKDLLPHEDYKHISLFVSLNIYQASW